MRYRPVRLAALLSFAGTARLSAMLVRPFGLLFSL